jgi:hypothetical protein
LLNFKNPEDQIARWFEILAAYDFEIEHRAGHSHANADGPLISYSRTTKERLFPIQVSLPFLSMILENLDPYHSSDIQLIFLLLSQKSCHYPMWKDHSGNSDININDNMGDNSTYAD